MGDRSHIIVTIAALVNILSSVLLFGSQIALYFVGAPVKVGFLIVYYINQDVVYASIGIWGGLIIFLTSVLFIIKKKGYKVGKILLAALAVIVGIIITALFSIEIDRFSQAFFSCSVHAKCDLVTVEALFITGGVISTLMSGCLAVEAIISK